LAYAIGLISMGGVIDKLGTKKGYTLAIATWSFFGMLHAAIRPSFALWGFIGARFGLGLGEAGSFPACIKAVAEWVPTKARAFATGIFNAATSVGAIAAPFVVGAIVSVDGKNWQIPFLITGALSATWVAIWWKVYRKPEEHPKVSKAELEYILSDSVEENTEKLPWASVLPKRQTWAFVVAKITDAVWWFYLFWGALFLKDTYGVDIKHIALPMLVVYLLADAGSIFGGHLSSSFIKRGWSINKSRKITLLICALIILPVSSVAIIHNQWLAIVLIGIGAAGHQAWSANIFTLVSDVFPKKATASVVGIGGMMGALAGMVSNIALGQVLDKADNHGYFYAFLIAGSLYLVILGIIHMIMPNMRPLDENLNPVEITQ
jgi:ACS family hexuronate transporter-like MFS transporter